MKRNLFRLNGATETDTGTAAADGTVTESPDEEESRRVARRRALLTGGAVVAGAVGAGAAMAATAAPASAATNSAILQGEKNTATAPNDPATEIAATSNSAPTPTLIVTNTGSPKSGQASPPLRITPAASGLTSPADGNDGAAPGDVTATDDGNLWFAHKNGTSAPIIATVHTDATSNSFVPLSAPYRVLDTRLNHAIRQYILDPSGNFDSSGRLLGGHTIHINLSNSTSPAGPKLVIYGDAVTANLTVIDPADHGWVLVWPGGSRPNASSIGFSQGEALANLTVSGIGHGYSSSVTDSIAIYAVVTTHVILDIAGFYVANFGQVTSQNPFTASAGQTAVRATQVQSARGQ